MQCLLLEADVAFRNQRSETMVLVVDETREASDELLGQVR